MVCYFLLSLGILNVFLIFSPVKEKIEGSSGNYTKELKVHRKKMSVADFKQIGNKKQYHTINPKVGIFSAKQGDVQS